MIASHLFRRKDYRSMENKKQEKRELAFDRYAIFQTGGKQYQALEGKTVAVEKLDVLAGSEVEFKEVLFRRANAETLEVGAPFLKTAVKAVVVKHDLGPKLIAFKFKRRKKYRRKIGHRQPMTIVRVVSI